MAKKCVLNMGTTTSGTGLRSKPGRLSRAMCYHRRQQISTRVDLDLESKVQPLRRNHGAVGPMGCDAGDDCCVAP